MTVAEFRSHVLPPGDRMTRSPAAVVFAALLFSTGVEAQARPRRPIETFAAGVVPMMASVDTTLFRGLSYRMVGPTRGGRVTTVTGVPSQPRTFYMGVASGGVFKTTDAGAHWLPITDGK